MMAVLVKVFCRNTKKQEHKAHARMQNVGSGQDVARVHAMDTRALSIGADGADTGGCGERRLLRDVDKGAHVGARLC